MLIAILTDIHANREALSACLDHAEAQHAQRYAFLGDLVGYGADPGWVLDTIISYVQDGAWAVMGNHDEAVNQTAPSHLHSQAQAVVDWTRERLDQRQRDFLAQLPLAQQADDCLFVHASAAQPEQWEYVQSTREAARSLQATHCRYTFCGHVHEPALYNLSASGNVSSFVPDGDSSIPLGTQRQWLIIPGSCGQPRDGNPAACYALFDDATHELTFFRVPYDYDMAAEKIRAAGLPPGIGNRLLHGR